ncbi:MAG: smalltalk protein [Bacteroidaceae bacterium]
MKNKEKWSVIINAILTAISTVIGTLFLGSCMDL